MGYGYGSECHLLRWMGRHRQAFDRAVCAALGRPTGTLRWLDFGFDARKDWPDAELKGLEFLQDATLMERWSAWWPQRRGIHNWDAVAWFFADSGAKLVLVEAKAHVAELRSK